MSVVKRRIFPESFKREAVDRRNLVNASARFQRSCRDADDCEP
jgi:hypothetical protein